MKVLLAIAALAVGQPGSHPLRVPQAVGQIDLRACNQSGRNATVAVAYIPVNEDRFVIRRWYTVMAGQCIDLESTTNRNFYLYADAIDGSGRSWQGAHLQCVEYPGPFFFYAQDWTTCSADQEERNFTPFTAEQPGPWTWTLEP